MGEARLKSEKREAQARRIVAAFEDFIDALIVSNASDGEVIDPSRAVDLTKMIKDSRENLVMALVAPPPK
ncbi:MAG TPA: hypothetical protein VIY48_13555 [Candidatus Paceibacterota bacterium]